jgi:hypothetical protein
MGEEHQNQYYLNTSADQPAWQDDWLAWQNG